MSPTLLSLALVACAPEAPGADTAAISADSATPAGEDEAEASDTASATCEAALAGVLPEDGDAEVSVVEPVEAWFEEPVEADLALLDARGEPVAGALESLDDRFGLRFVPDEPLAYQADHQLAVGACGASWSTRFTTLPEPELWEGYEGRVYVMALEALDIEEPEVLAELIDFLGMGEMLAAVQVVEVDVEARTLQLAVAAAQHEDEELVQDACEDVALLDPADFAGNPAFSAGPGELGFSASGVGYTFRRLSIEGRFSLDGERIERVDIEGWLDLSELSFDGEPGCEYLGHLGLPCESCPDADGERCLHLAGSASEAPWEPGLDLDLESGDCG